MLKSRKLSLIRMGVINITPNSFSDGGESVGLSEIESKLKQFGDIDVVDFGAESTAPMNAPISSEAEWDRLQVILPLLKDLKPKISIDTYHSETIFKMVKFWRDEKLSQTLIWNDISGKFDEDVKEFLKIQNVEYVFCHNLAPAREESGKHMKYLSEKTGEDFLQELIQFLSKQNHPKVIIDPCLGFSKTYDQNWMILDNFANFISQIPAERFMLGFSRKSFLRKKYNIDGLASDDRKKLDEIHAAIVKNLLTSLQGEIWVRTHRPELL